MCVPTIDTQTDLRAHTHDRCTHDVAGMSSLLVRTGVASGENVSVIRLADRRDGTIEKDWVFQREVEAALYGHVDIWSGTEEELRRSFGAVFAAVLDEENPRELHASGWLESSDLMCILRPMP